jgi:hypothetical protein
MFGGTRTQGGGLGGLTLGYFIAAPSGRRRASDAGQTRLEFSSCSKPDQCA